MFECLRDRLGDSHRVLIAGAGGGYDVLGAVPLVHFIQHQLGMETILSSLSFTNLRGIGAKPVASHPSMFPVTRKMAIHHAYCPEAWLAHWYHQKSGDERPIFSFEKTGVVPLLQAYQFLVQEYGIDAVILLDGGIDLILRGDERSLGTPAEDLTSLAAVSRLDLPVKIVGCVGFGVELRDGIRHAQVLRRIAQLTSVGGYYGASAMTAEQPAGREYLEALTHIFENQQDVKRSHVHRMIHDSMMGVFGADGQYIWVSPLMNLYWFFSLDAVARAHLFLEHLQGTNEIMEVSWMIEACRKDLEVLASEDIPI